MSLLSWFDNRTLYGCQCMLSVMFAILFLWMGRAYPMVRGVRSMACAFLVGIPGSFLLLSRGRIPDFLAINVADLLSAACFVLLYDGIVRFLGRRPRLWLVAGAGAVSICLVYYSTEIRPNLVLRIAAMGMLAALIRGMTGWELLRGSAERAIRAGSGSLNRSTSRGRGGVTRFFGVFLAALAAIGFLRVAMLLISGIPASGIQRGALQTTTGLLSVAYIGVYGLCFLAMAGHELITRSQEESERDLLSGALNRRGIETRLTTELKRSNRSGQKLSVALVDIDHFKSINDRYGHGTGDAAIRAVSLAISKSLRDVDYLGRYGGDEFLILLPMTSCYQATIASGRLSRSVNELTFLEETRRLSLSIGITEASPEDDAISLIARADEALYQAKSDGRDCMRIVMPMTTFPDAPMPLPVRIESGS
jgi:diguanylate cyclase (GGDEF)-like protein